MNKEEERIITTSFKVTPSLHKTLDAKIIADGYGMRGKSKWIKEAVEDFFVLDDYAELVYLSEEGINATCTISVRMPAKMVFGIEQAVIHVRKQYPEMEGVKSRILRSAILQRIIRT